MLKCYWFEWLLSAKSRFSLWSEIEKKRIERREKIEKREDDKTAEGLFDYKTEWNKKKQLTHACCV